MGDWTLIIRTALASVVGILSLSASLFCVEVGQEQETPSPIAETPSTEPARAIVTDLATSSESEPSLMPTPPVKAHVSDAIEEARRRRGSVLAGTVLEDAEVSVVSGDDFPTALARVSAEPDVTPLISVLPAGPQVGDALAEQPGGSDLLRLAARELEWRGADHEDHRRFEEADQLRRLASRLRREARRWDQGGSHSR